MPHVYVCRRCKGKSAKVPEGACLHCKGFYRHERKFVPDGEVDGAELAPIKDGEILSHGDLMAGKDEPEEAGFPSGSPGVDHVFGGRLPRRGAILVCSPAGSGKTTWLWGLLHKITAAQKKTGLYLSTEQRARALRAQFQRLCLPDNQRMLVCSEEDHDAALRAIEKADAEFGVLDSLHEMEGVTDEADYEMASGGARAVTRIAKEVKRLAHEMDALWFLVGHMTNEEALAGGSHLRHAVDAVLVFRYLHDDSDPHRILEFRGKSRFGEVGRRALFRMGKKGMEDLGPLIEERPGRPAPRRPREDGQLIPFPASRKKKPRATDDEEPEPPTAA